jgi:hypothetical protein
VGGPGANYPEADVLVFIFIMIIIDIERGNLRGIYSILTSDNKLQK